MTNTTTPRTDGGLHRGLTRRQISMMGLGSAIGAGLFVGSGQAISIAGPAVLVSYLVAGVIVMLVMSMLAEMVAADPSSGAFSAYAHKAMGRSAGSAVGWLYWFQLVVVVAAEATGAAAILAGWVPGVPQWAWVLAFIAIFTTINLFGVKNYGRMEFWFAAIKITAIIVFLIVGVCAIVGLIPNVPATGFANLVSAGGFAPNGTAGVASALLIVMFAFGGTELVAIAAAESDNPARNIKRIVREIVVRILVFYMGSVFVIVAVLPWDSAEVVEAPFGAVLAMLHVPGVDLIMSLLIVVALLSSMNANIYGSSRMIFSLGERHLAPRRLTETNSRGVPITAVVSSVAFGLIAVGLNWAWPDVVLPMLLNLVGSTVIVIWLATAISQLILRRRADRAGEDLPVRMRAFPAATILCLVLLAAVVALATTDSAVRLQLILTASLTLAIGLAARATRPKNYLSDPV